MKVQAMQAIKRAAAAGRSGSDDFFDGNCRWDIFGNAVRAPSLVPVVLMLHVKWLRQNNDSYSYAASVVKEPVCLRS